MFLFAEGEHQSPLIVQFVNHYLGEPVYKIQMATTHVWWTKFFANFGTTPEKVFGGEYTPENAIPWYTIMFVIACTLSIVIIWIMKGKLSEDDPGHGQLTLEAGFLAVKDLVVNVIGEHGLRYFPVVATFAVLILVSNLMGQFPMFMPPTGSVNVTYALALTSFVYYNYIGIHENGFINHLAHLTGPKLPLIMMIFLTPLIFSIELISNMIRPFTLGVRLFANMFADEQLAAQVAGLAPPYTQFLIPVVLLPLAFFVAFVQTLVFTLLSMIYISEVSHAPHDHADESHGEAVAAHA
jgi:F-type H+-transporting ATPase subunit a